MPTPKFRNIAKAKLQSMEPTYTESDVTTQNPVTSEEKVDYKATVTGVAELSQRLSAPTYDKPMNLKFIPRSKIIFNKKNHIPITQEYIQDLAESILTGGLISPLEALYDEDQDIYRLDAGHARTMALDMLIEKYKGYPVDCRDTDYADYKENIEGFLIEGYPVIIKKKKYIGTEVSAVDEIDSELRLMDDNIKRRDPTPSQKAELIVRRAELIKEKNALLSKNQRVNVNKTIGADFGITDRQVQKYKSINRGLIPELKELFDKGAININDGDIWSKLSHDEQRSVILPLVQQLVENGMKATKSAVDNERKKINEIEEELERQKQAKEEAENNLSNQVKAFSKLEDNKNMLESRFREELETIKNLAIAEKEALQKDLDKAKKSGSPEAIEIMKGRIAEIENSTSKTLARKQEEFNDILQSKETEVNKLNKKIMELQNENLSQGKDIENAIRIHVEAATKVDIAIEQLTSAHDTIISYFESLSPSYKHKVTENLQIKTSDFLSTLKK